MKLLLSNPARLSHVCWFPVFVSLVVGLVAEEEHLEKDYHFFVGVRLEIPHEGELYPVSGMLGDSLLIADGDEVIRKSIHNLGEFRYHKEAKLTNNLVYIDNLKCEEGYSMAADPEIQAARVNIALANVAGDRLDRSVASEMNLANVAAELDDIRARANRGDMGAGFSLPQVERRLDMAQSEAASTLQSSMLNEATLNDNRVMSKKDVLNVSFDVSSMKDIDDPYLLLIASLKSRKNAKPEHTWFHFRPLGDIRRHQIERISFSASSFPDGMMVHDYELFVFSGPVEIPSNLSPKRVAMTRENAQKFMNYQYINQNFDKTLEPSLIEGTLSRRILDFDEKPLLDLEIRIQVDPQGEVTGFHYSTPTPTPVRLDSLLDALRSAMYYPALENGEAVEGELVFNLRKAAAAMGTVSPQ